MTSTTVPRKTYFAAALAMANAVPFIGISAWDWGLLNIVSLALFEAFVFGVVSVVKLVVIDEVSPWDILVAFFIFFGALIFCGLLLKGLLSEEAAAMDPKRLFFNPQSLFAMAMIVGAQLFALYFGFFRKGEYRHMLSEAVFFDLFLRGLGVQAIVAAGCFAIDFLGRTWMTLSVLMAVKVFFEYFCAVPLAHRDTLAE